jgi:hypothetical protein
MTQYQKDFLYVVATIISIVVIVSIPVVSIINWTDNVKCRNGGYADSIVWNGTKLCIGIHNGQFEILPMDKLEKMPDAE